VSRPKLCEVHARSVEGTNRLCDLAATEQCRRPQLVAAREEHARGLLQAQEPATILGIAPGVEIDRGYALGTERGKEALVTHADIAHLARGRDDYDVGPLATRQFDEATQDCQRVVLLLGTPDRDDSTPLFAFSDLACAHPSIPSLRWRDDASQYAPPA
jgi:hypothetical protein